MLLCIMGIEKVYGSFERVIREILLIDVGDGIEFEIGIGISKVSFPMPFFFAKKVPQSTLL